MHISFFIEQFKGRLELIFNHLKSIDQNSNLTHHRIKQIRVDLYQRIELRNNHYHQKFLLLLHELCLIKSDKKHLQFLEKEYYYSKQFFNKIFNIQSFIYIDPNHQQYEQSIKCLCELQSTVQEYENNLDQLKQKVVEQNKQINMYSTNLHQIQFEKNQILSDIQQLKQQILFEKKLYTEIQLTLTSTDINQESHSHHDLLNQLHTEYINLTSQITQIQLNIEQKSIDLLPLQLELYIYHTILESKDQSLLLPTTTTIEQISQHSAVMINQFQENRMQAKLQMLPMEMISQSEYTKIRSRKSK